MPVMPPEVLDSLDGEARRSIGKPWGNVHFVGTETADMWQGYMEGAIRSGLRGARESIALLIEEGNQTIRSSL
jgi:monoamine oxidase